MRPSRAHVRVNQTRDCQLPKKWGQKPSQRQVHIGQSLRSLNFGQMRRLWIHCLVCTRNKATNRRWKEENESRRLSVLFSTCLSPKLNRFICISNVSQNREVFLSTFCIFTQSTFVPFIRRSRQESRLRTEASKRTQTSEMSGLIYVQENDCNRFDCPLQWRQCERKETTWRRFNQMEQSI